LLKILKVTFGKYEPKKYVVVIRFRPPAAGGRQFRHRVLDSYKNNTPISIIKILLKYKIIIFFDSPLFY